MKKILILLFLLIISLQTVSAKNYTLKFNGEKYSLLYSAKNKDFGGYINEYFKPRETYNIWSEMIAVHHFPNAYSPIDRIRDFKNYLGSMNVPSSLTFDDIKNTAMIDFILISDKQMPIVMEFNIFKYEKSKKCGSIAVQYAKRYSAATTLQIEQIKADFEKNRKRLIKQVKKLEIPAVIDEDIDKCISAIGVKNQTDEEIKQEQEAQAQAQAQKEKDMEEQLEKNQEEAVNTNSQEELNAEEDKDLNVKTETQPEAKAIADESTEDKNVESTITESVAKTENITLNKNKIEEAIAPIPAVEPEVKKETVQVSNKKKKKDTNYEVINAKDDYIAKPRTKKELKNEVKQNKLKQQQNKKDAKKQAKIDKKKQKEELKSAKKAEKMEKIPYEMKNTNNALIAEPRTKKELKKQTKMMKKQAKKRAKQAKNKLSE